MGATNFGPIDGYPVDWSQVDWSQPGWLQAAWSHRALIPHPGNQDPLAENGGPWSDVSPIPPVHPVSPAGYDVLHPYLDPQRSPLINHPHNRRAWAYLAGSQGTRPQSVTPKPWGQRHPSPSAGGPEKKCYAKGVSDSPSPSVNRSPKMLRPVLITGLALLALIGVLILRTITWKTLDIPPENGALPSAQPNSVNQPNPVNQSNRVDQANHVKNPNQQEQYVKHLAEALRFETVSHAPTAAPSLSAAHAFEDFHFWLQRTYPLTWNMLSVIQVHHTLLLRWNGSQPTLPPVLFMAHQDVVPAENPTSWDVPVFSGKVHQGTLHGRGVVDCKASLVALLEATESLLQNDFSPKRTLYFAFGADEEIGGVHGNKLLAERFRNQNTRFAWVLDEGHVVTRNMIPGVQHPVAMIGIAERGYASIKLTAHGQGGHTSMPELEPATSKLAQAISQLHKHPMPAAIDGAVATTFDALVPHMDWPYNMLFANRWLFAPLLVGKFTSKPSTNALLRTTLAPTVLTGSSKDNVLAQQATAIVNARIHPRDSIERVVQHVQRAIDNPEIRVEVLQEGVLKSEPSPTSSTRTLGYQTIANAIHRTFPKAAVVPALSVPATDSRYYTDIADGVYRFMPFEMTPQNRAVIHGANERITLDNLKRYLTFYRAIIQLAANASP